MLSNAFQHFDSRVFRFMRQHFVVNAECPTEIILFLKALPHHQARMKSDLVRTATGVDLVKEIRRLNQRRFTLFCASVESLATFVCATNQIEPGSQVFGFGLLPFLVFLFIPRLIDELCKGLVSDLILVLSLLKNIFGLINQRPRRIL